MMKLYLIALSFVLGYVTTSSCDTFQGKVIDQNKDPVPEAEVCISHVTPSFMGRLLPFLPDWNSVVHHRWDVTKKDGTFRVSEWFGYDWRVSGAHSARKTGYEYMYPIEYDSTNRFYLVHMRKRLNPCFLHHEPYADCQFSRPGRSITWDFIQNEKVQVDPPKKRPNSSWPLPRHIPDVLIEARFDDSNSTWILAFRSKSEKGCFFASTNKVYEAPLDGYVDHLLFPIPVNPRRQIELGPKCLVLRSRTPRIFTRLDITGIVATDEFLRLCFDAYTNPYGDRALDIDARVEKDFYIRKKLIEDSQKAWQEGHPPVKPDFQVLLKNVNEFK